MIKSALAILATGSLMLSANPTLAQERTFDFGAIKFIEAHSGIDVTIYYGNDQSVIATANTENDLENLKLSYENGRLIAAQSNDFWNSMSKGNIIDAIFGKTEPIKVSITATDISEILATSGANVELTQYAGRELSVDASSGAAISIVDASFDLTDLHASSGGSINAHGACAKLIAGASTGAQISAHDLTCLTAEARVSTGAGIEINVSDAILAYATTGGSIEVVGGAPTQEIHEGTGGSVDLAP